ncbi:MAG: phosphotransferase, partial [Anaerolineales bacterium]|nr:phosphotransferase [Anaerolineales bacterium]
MTEPVAFDQHEIRCPAFPPAAAQALLAEHYGLTAAELKPLASFQDQNFRVTDAAGRRFVLKIANTHETWETLDLQNQAMRHLAAKDPAFPTPRVVPSLAGGDLATAEHAGQRHFIRLLTYLEGQPLAEAAHCPPGLLDDLGDVVGRLTAHLADFDHPAGARVIQWDLRQAQAVAAAFLKYVGDERRRRLIQQLLAQFTAEAEPLLPGLRQSLIHGDIVDYNLLIQPDAQQARRVSGLIDFGDTVRSYTVGELAVLLATVMAHSPAAPLAAAARVVGRFHAAFPLTEAELAALFPLVGLRVCATTTSAAQQAALEPDNAYVQEFAAAEWPTLERVAGLSPAVAHAMFRAACGLEPHPRSPAVQAWLRANAGQLSPLLNADLASRGVTVMDLGAGSDDLRDGVWERPGAVRAHIARTLKERGAGLGLGRHGEARLSYTRYDSPAEPETIHLGVEIFVPAETAVFAPLAGEVARLGWNELIVRHAPAPGCEFYTRYAGLAPAEVLTLGGRVQRGEMVGRVAAADVGAPLPPHLHFQLACELPGDLPALAAGSERAVWLSLCPDPNLILNIPD